ncbi:MAG: METTL5 family protein [Candidatus Methanomethylophilaceae archaeon]|jgi:putative methylase|nr:METTL5 family protein [Candidatus Methanomethylophilaceae archaeon]NLF34310.1 methyltransferase [Thermoplasmatales archaeon]
MKKRDLEIALESVAPFRNPDPSLEQYPTPAPVAADVLFSAYSNGDIAGMKVVDLGCGTGVFSIGARLLGAGRVIGFDVSGGALETARENASSAGADVEFVLSDVRDVSEPADTVIMNPPFGCQNRRADRAFLDKAMELSECVYSIHMARTEPFIEEYAESRGRRIVYRKTYKYDIPNTFPFHKKMKQSVDILAVNIR